VRLKPHIRRAGEAEVALALGCAPLGAPLCHENLNSCFQGFRLKIPK